MINGNYLSISEEIVFYTIVEEKNNPGKSILTANTAKIINAYNQYLVNFDNLTRQDSSIFLKTEIDERHFLQAAYLSKIGSFPLLRGMIFAKQPATLKAFCPYCLLGWPGTMDHYIGQAEFPEYSILVKNLIPCCGDCNRIKDNIWRKNKIRRIIHFYQDTFINERFLFAKLVQHRHQSTPKIHFYLKKPANITVNEFKIVKNHFKDLNLIWKYNERANALIASQISDLKQSVAEGRDRVMIKRELIITYNNLSKDFGVNYWQGVLSETIAVTKKVIDSLFK